MDRHFIHFETPELATLVNDAAPPPGQGEVLIAVDHAGINRADLLQRLGLYPPPEDASPIPGLEVAGQVVAVIGAVREDAEDPGQHVRVKALNRLALRRDVSPFQRRTSIRLGSLQHCGKVIMADVQSKLVPGTCGEEGQEGL